MKAIITGASGLIGSRFIELYGESFEKLYQLGRTRAEINSEWIEYDFSSGLPIDLPEVDVIFHFAGQTSIYQSKDNVFEDLYINTIGFLRLLESARKYKKQAFVVLAGTSTQVGFTEELNPVNEKFSNNPITFYDISKLTAENYLLQFVREGWIKGCSLRLCNVYGALKDGMNIERGVIDKVFQRLLKGEDVNIFGNGQYVRDYIHIDDVVSAGTSINEAVSIINSNDGNVCGIIVAIDRQEKGLSDMSATQDVSNKFNIPILSIITLDNIIEYLTNQNNFKNELKFIKEYRKEYGAS